MPNLYSLGGTLVSKEEYFAVRKPKKEVPVIKEKAKKKMKKPLIPSLKKALSK